MKPTILLVALALLGSFHTFAAGNFGEPNAARRDTLPPNKLTERILLENDTVRVTEAILPPGQSEPVHSHQWASVIYIMEAGDFIDRDGSGKVLLDTRKLPAPLTLPFTTWKRPGGPHSVENLSKTTAMRLLRVEIKR